MCELSQSWLRKSGCHWRGSPDKPKNIQLMNILERVAYRFSRGIFLTQGLNPGLLPCRQILYRLSQQGSPRRGREGSKNVHLLFVHPTHHREAVTVASRPERVTMPERKVSGTRRVWCGDSRAVDPATTLRRSHV